MTTMVPMTRMTSQRVELKNTPDKDKLAGRTSGAASPSTATTLGAGPLGPIVKNTILQWGSAVPKPDNIPLRL